MTKSGKKNARVQSKFNVITTRDQSPGTKSPAHEERAAEPSAWCDGETSTPATGFVDGTAEGIVVFPSQSSVSYRYILTYKGAKVKIWLENRKTKQQWDSGELLEEEIVKPDAVIPHATLKEYAQCFHNCLCIGNPTETTDFQRELKAASNEEMHLILKLKVRVFMNTWTTSYPFVMRSVSLAPLDVVSAMVRDQAEEISNLREELAHMEAQLEAKDDEIEDLERRIDAMEEKERNGEHVALIRAVTTQQRNMNQTLIWTLDTSRRGDAFVELLSSGKIRFRVGAVVGMFISVVHNSSSNGAAFQLRSNGIVLRTCRDANANGCYQTSTMRHIVDMAANDEIDVVYVGNQCTREGSLLILNLLALR